jgi:hypothetical protein
MKAVKASRGFQIEKITSDGGRGIWLGVLPTTVSGGSVWTLNP